MELKFVALSTAAVLASAYGASAADIPAGMPTKAPAAMVAQTWTGVYVGVTAGGVWGRAKDIWEGPALPERFGLTVSDTETSGFIGGGTLGANWQFGSIVSTSATRSTSGRR